MQQKTLIISTIELIRSPKFRDGFSFRINGNSKNAIWANRGFILNIFTNMGLNPQGTSFQQLRGSTLSYYELDVTQEMLEAGGGKHTIKSPRDGREIDFSNTGKKQVDLAMLNVSDQLTQAIFAKGVEFDSSWASTNQPAAVNTPTVVNNQPTVTPAPEAHAEEEVVVEEDGEDNTLADAE